MPRKTLLLVVVLVLQVVSCAPAFDPKALLQFSATQLQATATQVSSHSLYPRSTEKVNGKTEWTPLVKPGDWTCGFFPASLWQLYNFTGSENWRNLAESWTQAISSQQNNTGTHDVGFMVFYTFAKGYELTGNAQYKQVALQTAHSLSTRYSSVVGCIRSWDDFHFPVIVDNMMNLELLFWAAANGGSSSFHEIAVNHSDHTMNDIIRKAGNSWHMVDYNPQTGAIIGQYNTPQGYDSPNGTWSRGQGWAVYGFTMAYRYTKLQRYLDTARLCAEWYLAHVPSDWVPYWDFGVPQNASSPRDSSAASIIAGGLLELSKYVDKDTAQKYVNAAVNTLASLGSDKYLSNQNDSDSILQHATGSYPDKSEIDVSLIYGDYYFIEALLRYLNL